MDDKKSLEDSLDLLGSKWTLQIISTLLEKDGRFNEIQRECDICPRTLSLRLDGLENNGIVTKRLHSKASTKFEYSLTEKGRSLNKVLMAISDWSRIK
jgi:DNA-binding HxlR family transcriptional regulator